MDHGVEGNTVLA